MQALAPILIFATIILLAILIAQYVRLRDTKNAVEFNRNEIERLSGEKLTLATSISERDKIISILEADVMSLSPYRKILNVEEAIHKRKAEYMRAENEAKAKMEESLRKSKATIESETAALKNELAESRREMKEKRAHLEEHQKALLNSASRESERIVLEANKRAEEIAGDAIVALRDARKLEETAKAMKNVIAGYGDEYLVPSASLLDDLAEEFSHKDAGVELKTARTRANEMVRNSLAAECSYAEARRKESATHFVLDAFNGKVDSILSMVKHDNYGKLEQEIRDAFNLVNHNGKAFRDARIRHEYLEARIQELKWAVTVVELKLQEREEQRAIKQAMREEERARKEFEKAIREAEKEEKLIQKAMEQARKELEAATDEQRAEFESKLKELERKLLEAETKNQRAMSMAQQTKRGHVYVISNVGSFGENIYKIGLTRRLEPLDRVKELGDASVPFEFDVHAMIYSDDAPKLEADLHREFATDQLNKINPRKEFFRVQLSNIRTLLESKDISTHWTMAAEAREYRESLAIEADNSGHKKNLQKAHA